MDNKQNNYANFIKENKIVKSSVNGLYRFLVLWIIKYNGKIHGYSIMKELDKFFVNLIDEKAIKKSSPSKIYPILRQMENFNLINGSWEYLDKKKIKYYQITEKGEFFIIYLFQKVLLFEENSQWKLMIDDLLSDW